MKFIAEDSELIIILEGWEIVFGLKRKISIPRDCITSLEWQEDYTFDTHIWRAGGAGIPGVLYAGHFFGGGHRYFLYLLNPRGWNWAKSVIITQNTLVITTQDFAYKQLLLTCKADIGAELINWWRGTSSPK
jgi:hypothetical protein